MAAFPMIADVAESNISKITTGEAKAFPVKLKTATQATLHCALGKYNCRKG